MTHEEEGKTRRKIEKTVDVQLTRGHFERARAPAHALFAGGRQRKLLST